MISSSFINTGVCRNIDIANVFHVSKRSIIRNCQKYSEFGAEGFIGGNKGKGKRKGNIFTDSKIERAEELLSSGFSRSETADKIGVKYSTLSKAVQDGRIEFSKPDETGYTDKSARSIQDTQAGEALGVGCTNVIERTLSSFGLSGVVKSNFKRCNDVKNGGILATLPFLAANGLFHKTKECFGEFKGYYSVLHILTLLAFMALCRIKTVEKLRWESPGEFGKLLGLDRIAEVRCLRKKLGVMSSNDAAVKWGEILSKKWMDEEPELAGVLYVDGHVRLYGGKEKLPKQFVSRQKLCLRGVMDFWINDKFGKPFFVIRKDINPGMLKVLRNDIVPRLLREVPNQPSEEMLKKDPYLYKFILVFDREGYSPEFFKDMWTKHRIACMTYNKYPKEDWAEEEFKEHTIDLINGEKTVIKLADRGTYIGDKKKGTWVHEIRKLTKSGHQTSIITTAFLLPITLIAVLMFARWCQENFFNYMMKHFAIDLLSDYLKKDVDVTESIVSPKWRTLEKKINSLVGKLKTRKSRFGDLTLNPILENDEKNYKEWVITKTELAEDITLLENKISIKKKEQKKNDKHIKVVDLPEEDSFKALSSSKKHLVDTVKMISYRAETVMASLLYKQCKSFEQARALLRQVFVTEADLIPDKEKKILWVRIHNLPTKAMDRRLDYLIDTLNSAEMKYPGTNMLLKYQRLGT